MTVFITPLAFSINRNLVVAPRGLKLPLSWVFLDSAVGERGERSHLLKSILKDLLELHTFNIKHGWEKRVSLWLEYKWCLADLSTVGPMYPSQKALLPQRLTPSNSSLATASPLSTDLRSWLSDGLEGGGGCSLFLLMGTLTGLY